MIKNNHHLSKKKKKEEESPWTEIISYLFSKKIIAIKDTRDTIKNLN